MRHLLTRISRKLGLGYCFDAPEFVWLENTQRCNLRCVICPKSWEGPVNRDIHPVALGKFQQDILPHAKTINLSSFGEPLVQADFEQLADMIISQGKKLLFVTNGLLLKPLLMEKLVKAGGCVVISIDSLREDMTEEIRGRPMVSVLLEKMKLFSELRKKYPGSGFELQTNTILFKSNVQEMPEFIETMVRYGVDKIEFLQLETYNRTDPWTKESLLFHPDLAGQYFPIIEGKAKECHLEIELPQVPRPLKVTETSGARQKREAFSHRTKGRTKRFPAVQRCYYPWMAASIDVYGQVRACCFFQAEVLGDLTKQEWKDIWNGPKFRQLRRRVNSANPPDYCKRCTFIRGINRGSPPDWPPATGC